MAFVLSKSTVIVIFCKYYTKRRNYACPCC